VGTYGQPLYLPPRLDAVFAVRPAVVDTNVLKSDVLQACFRAHQTALLLSGEYGLRLFCSEHVIAEFEEHLEEWVAGLLPVETVRAVFERYYVPILRVVRVPSGPLHSDEAERIARLRTVDPDDVPTAILAMLLHAPVLTRDRPLLRAVHGDDADIDSRQEWLDVALAGRTLSETDKQMWAAGAGLDLMGRGTVAGTRAVVRAVGSLPPVLQLAVMLAGIGMGIVAIANRKSIADAASRAGRGFVELYGPAIATWYQERQLSIAWVHAADPPLLQAGTASGLPLAPSALGRSALTRVCIYALGRAPEGLSAEALASALPTDLPMATGVAKVRQVLRTHRSFYQLPRGRWQLGKPAGVATPVLAAHDKSPSA
jgi:predicted nucleic acid-binding protein